MIQKLTGVFWGGALQHLWREEGKKEAHLFLMSALIHTGYILFSGSVENLVIQFALAMFQVTASPEQSKHG